MNRMSIGCAVIAAAAAGATADTIYQTKSPFGSPLGVYGFDVFINQSVGVRFTPTQDYTLDEVSVWFMNNDFSGQEHAEVTLSVRTDFNDGQVSYPSEEILDETTFIVSAVGWDPILESISSVAHPVLKAGENYWIVCVSDSPPFVDGVWCVAANDSGFNANTDGDQTTWQPGGFGAVVATIVEGTPATSCAADCNQDGAVNVFDFLCFQGLFTKGDPAADCNADGSTNIFDFLCFQGLVTEGCE